MRVLSTNILSPLGSTTEENYRAVSQGRTALAQHTAGTRGIPFSFCAGMFAELPDFTDLCIRSAREALSRVRLSPSAGGSRGKALFILSTTKGRMGEDIGETAKKIAAQLGIGSEEPVVVCNACVSGVSAQVLALRLLKAGMYDYAVVTGADVLNRFIVSGFHSLKSLSPEPCRPFDMERLGLNLGEAAATMVFGVETEVSTWGDLEGARVKWVAEAGAICNDAWHISNPHPKGDGAYKALMQVLQGADREHLACLGVHGTATMYNDQMEAMAIDRAKLNDVPVSALKGYYGHTLGAAGLLETIITMRALDDGIILPSRGFEELGVSRKINVSPEALSPHGTGFVKMLSGFGGVNAAVRYAQV